jgi:predicted RNA-binding protein
LLLKIKKIINKQINKINDDNGFINLKVKYPKIKKIIFVVEIKKFVKNNDLFFLYKTW